MTGMAYDIEADWQLLNTCNYRCGYCFFGPELLGEKLRVHAAPAQWEAAFAATGRIWKLHITGGEPSLYPDFAELCARLTRRHTMSLNSNLSHPGIVRFAEAVDPARVDFVNAGFHPFERALRGGTARFIAHARMLRARGFALMVSIVATPEVLADFDAAAAPLRAVGISPFPKALRGHWRGALYPESYTDTERRRFRGRSARARADNRALLDAREPGESVDFALDDGFLDGLQDFTGTACAAGQRFVRLHGDGAVFRCSTHDSLGNLLDGTLRLRGAPAPCDAAYCPYFCVRYTGAAMVQAAAGTGSFPRAAPEAPLPAAV